MANKFAFGLVAAGALTGICIGIGQAMTEHLPKAQPAVAVAPQPKVVQAAPVEVATPEPAPVVMPAEADLYDCQHYLRAAVSYMKAAKFDQADAEIAKAKQEGCPTDVPLY